MNVIIISQCEKKSIKKTNLIVDSFLGRIGDRAWTGAITEEGLNSLKKMLKKTASKNTAVSCLRITTRKTFELSWIVGNRKKFSSNGYVPVNYTNKDCRKYININDWNDLITIKYLSSIAGIFHDIGKSNHFFQSKLIQKKIIKDPVRHDFLSYYMFLCFVNNEPTNLWLNRLAKGDFSVWDNEDFFLLKNKKEYKKKVKNLDDFTYCVAYLILSHHRLPNVEKDDLLKYYERKRPDLKSLLIQTYVNWGYGEIENDTINECLSFSRGMIYNSILWKKEVIALSQKALKNICYLTIENTKIILYFSRLSLMLSDYYISSLKKENTYDKNLLYANTINAKGKMGQHLDDHLIMVSKKASEIVHYLPYFENNFDLPRVYDNNFLKMKSPLQFDWQNKSVQKILIAKKDKDCFPFFGIIKARTGTGKTIGLAKIARALSEDNSSFRFLYLTGLVTLTLQNGDKFKKQLKLSQDELAVIVGSRIVQELNKRKNLEQDYLLEEEIIYDLPNEHGFLDSVVKNEKHKKFLYAPVVCCTIDYMMGATETIKGGRWILPFLRLMSSDLIIDEIDSFSNDDLVAIQRLVYLAGLLGQNVLLSSATITDELAEGFYKSFSLGYKKYQKRKNTNNILHYGFFSENETIIHKNLDI